MKKLLKFSATWCGPCKSLSKSFENVNLGDVELVNIDIDEDSETAIKYGIRGVPTLVLVEGDTVLKRKTGAMNVEQIEEFIK